MLEWTLMTSEAVGGGVQVFRCSGVQESNSNSNSSSSSEPTGDAARRRRFSISGRASYEEGLAAAATYHHVPAEAVYWPYGGARALWESRAPEVLLSGPAGTGKSRACLEKGYYLARKYPGSRGLIARKTRASLTEAALVTFEEKVLPPGAPLRYGPQRENREVYRLGNGSEIVVGGMDRPSRVMSTEYDWFCANTRSLLRAAPSRAQIGRSDACRNPSDTLVIRPVS
jgi:hypothetical protein